MKITINLSSDGKLIRIFIPAQLGRHSGRKAIFSPQQPTHKPGPQHGSGCHAVQRACQGPPLEPLADPRPRPRRQGDRCRRGDHQPQLRRPLPPPGPTGLRHPVSDPRQHPSCDLGFGRFHGSVSTSLGTPAKAVWFLKSDADISHR
jgi:hypothetical protein